MQTVAYPSWVDTEFEEDLTKFLVDFFKCNQKQDVYLVSTIKKVKLFWWFLFIRNYVFGVQTKKNISKILALKTSNNNLQVL